LKNHGRSDFFDFYYWARTFLHSVFCCLMLVMLNGQTLVADTETVVL